jgi:hypothetical protein
MFVSVEAADAEEVTTISMTLVNESDAVCAIEAKTSVERIISVRNDKSNSSDDVKLW